MLGLLSSNIIQQRKNAKTIYKNKYKLSKQGGLK